MRKALERAIRPGMPLLYVQGRERGIRTGTAEAGEALGDGRAHADGEGAEEGAGVAR